MEATDWLIHLESQITLPNTILRILPDQVKRPLGKHPDVPPNVCPGDH